MTEDVLHLWKTDSLDGHNRGQQEKWLVRASAPAENVPARWSLGRRIRWNWWVAAVTTHLTSTRLEQAVSN